MAVSTSVQYVRFVQWESPADGQPPPQHGGVSGLQNPMREISMTEDVSLPPRFRPTLQRLVCRYSEKGCALSLGGARLEEGAQIQLLQRGQWHTAEVVEAGPWRDLMIVVLSAEWRGARGPFYADDLGRIPARLGLDGAETAPLEPESE